jgi:hypothetical protein
MASLLTNPLIVCSCHSGPDVTMLLVAFEARRPGLRIVGRLRNMSQDDMLRQVPMRHILILVRVLKPLVRIDWVAPNSITDQLAQAYCDRPSIHQILHATIYLLVDTLDDVVSVVEAIEEFHELRVTHRTQWPIYIIHRQGEGIGPNNTLDISTISQLLQCLARAERSR